MNLIVLEPADFVAEDRVHLVDRRLVHARKHLKVSPGDTLKVGLLDELAAREPGRAPAPNLGVGEVLRCDRELLELRVRLERAPPPRSPITLAVALPRPPSLAKVLQQGTALGVKRFVLFHSKRVEKTYWQASAMEPGQLRRQLLLGLEQCVDTVLPQIELCPHFRPFAEERLASERERGPVLVGDPYAERGCPIGAGGEPLCLVLGPEGGFIDYERERFASLGDTLVSLGPRILRVETAAVALLARLAPAAMTQ